MNRECQCESSTCDHGHSFCRRPPSPKKVKTIYGRFAMCEACAAALPNEYKASDDAEIEIDEFNRRAERV